MVEREEEEEEDVISISKQEIKKKRPQMLGVLEV